MPTVEERVDSATTSSSKWNYWPDKLELVHIRRYDLTKPDQAYKAGKLLGSASADPNRAHRQVIPTNLPYEVCKAIGIDQRSAMLNVWFTLASPRGQGDDEATRNILAIFENPSWPVQSLHVLELGCQHDYDTAGSRMCYTTGKCRRCGHYFVCDSSD